MEKEISMMASSKRNAELVGSLMWNFFDNPLLFRMEVNGQKNIEDANTFFKNGGSAYLGHDHPGSFDPGYILRFRRDYLPGCLYVGYFESLKMADGRMRGFRQVIEYAKTTGLLTENWPVVQKNDFQVRKNPTEADFQRMNQINQKAIRNGIKFIQRPSSVVNVALTGTRSIDGKIHKPLAIVPRFFAAVSDYASFLPIGIEGSGRVHRKGNKYINPLAVVRINVGKLVSYGELRQDAFRWGVSVGDAMMMHVARLKPVQYWGDYRQIMEQIM